MTTRRIRFLRCIPCSRTHAGRACLAAVTGLALMLATGCRRGPAVVFVEGVVRMDGQPLEGASVAFTPVEAKGELPAAGFTDSSGRFVLSARGAGLGRGTTVGDYIVIVKKEVVPPGQEEALDPVVELQTAKQYLQKETSPLRATVKQGRNRFEFDLTSDKK
jgi:hypothetical protein